MYNDKSIMPFADISSTGFRTPFNIYVHTNDREATTDTDSGNRGFCLNYVQQPCSTVTGK